MQTSSASPRNQGLLLLATEVDVTRCFSTLPEMRLPARGATQSGLTFTTDRRKCKIYNAFSAMCGRLLHVHKQVLKYEWYGMISKITSEIL